MDALAKPMNDNLNREQRRYQMRLKVTAFGVMLFAAWNIIRSAMMSALRSDAVGGGDLTEILNSLDERQKLIFVVGTFIFIFTVLVLDTVFRIRIFQLARRESRDPSAPRKNSYLIMAGILAVLGVISIVMTALEVAAGDYDMIDGVISTLIEFGSIATLLELIEAAVKLRKLRDEVAAHE